MMMFSRGIASALLQDLGGHAGADGAAAFADRKPQLLLHRDRRDQLDRHLRVAPRHHHLPPRRQLHRPRHVRRPQVKLRPIPLEKRRMPPAFLFGQDVHFALELRVRRDRLRLRQHHPPLHLVLLHPAQQQADVVPRLPLIQQLAEHLHPRHHHLLVRPKPHHLHFLPHLHLPPLDPARRHRPPPRDRKHVLHRHQERLLHLPLRHRNARVQRRQQLLHLPHPRLVPPPVIQTPPPPAITTGFPPSPFGPGMPASSAANSSSPFPPHALSPAIAFSADPRITGTSSPGNSYLLRSSRTSSSTRSNSSASSTKSHLLRNTTIAGTFTCRASKMCSRVCGIGPSTADTTRIAPSICAAPVIMFFT